MPSTFRRLIGVALALALILSSPLRAEEESKRDTEVLKRQIAEEKEAAELARKARSKRSLDQFSKVTFAQVLQDPDNVQLNFRYAQEQVADNNLLGAASTLERVLMIQPDLHTVRLFYAVVLFRLDNLVDAKKQLEQLSEAELLPQVRDEVKLYQKQIKRRQKRTRVTLRQSVGFGMETNRNAAPSSKRRLVRDVPFGLAGATSKQRDTNFLNVTSVDITHDLGFAAGHEVFGNFTYFMQEQTKVDSLDLGAIQYELGATIKTPFFNFIPSFTGSHISLSRESFGRNHGGNFRVEKQLTPKVDVYSAFRIEYQDFLPVTENPTAPERKGRDLGLRAGGNIVLTPTMRLSGEVLYGNKNAKHEFNAYERFQLRTYHTWLLGKGQYVINSLDAIFDFYDEPDVAVAGRHRRDKGLRYRVSYGAPLTTLLIGKILPKPLKDISLALSYEYYRSLSTITNNTYTNNKFQGILTKKWEF